MYRRAPLQFLIAIVVSSASVASPFVTVDGQRFIDPAGRHLLLHGINIVNKSTADNYIPWETREDFARLRDWGMNCIRLGIIWDGLEPSPGEYDEDYLAQIDQLIARAAEFGLYVLLDMHQDLFSVLYSDGAPEWATLTDDKPHIHTGAVWSDAYFTSPAVQTAFDNFWANTPGPDSVGVQDRFALAWQFVAKRYANNLGVIGYDLWNEPNMGSGLPAAQMAMVGAFAQELKAKLGETAPGAEEIAARWLEPSGRSELTRHLADITLYENVLDAVEPIYQEFERTQLLPMYRRVVSAIREVDRNHIVFLEPCVSSNVGIRSAIEPVVNADGSRDPLQAYAPHTYDLVLDTPDQAAASAERIAFIFQRHAETARRLDMPVLVGEWGAYGGAGPEILPAAWTVVRQLETHGFSETYWDHGRGLAQAAYVEVLARPVPVAVAGTLTSYGFDRETGTFTCTWNEAAQRDTPTRIYLPAALASLQPAVVLESPSEHYMEISPTSQNAFLNVRTANQPGTRRLTVRPK